MSATRPETGRKVLAFASFVEAGTGFALIVDPAIVVKLLLGAGLSGIGPALSRCFGIAVLALAVACWPGGRDSQIASSSVRAMGTYNALIGVYLTYLATVHHLGGVLLWPGVVLHAVVALLLAREWRGDRRRPVIAA